MLSGPPADSFGSTVLVPDQLAVGPAVPGCGMEGLSPATGCSRLLGGGASHAQALLPGQGSSTDGFSVGEAARWRCRASSGVIMPRWRLTCQARVGMMVLQLASSSSHLPAAKVEVTITQGGAPMGVPLSWFTGVVQRGHGRQEPVQDSARGAAACADRWRSEQRGSWRQQPADPGSGEGCRERDRGAAAHRA